MDFFVHCTKSLVVMVPFGAGSCWHLYVQVSEYVKYVICKALEFWNHMIIDRVVLRAMKSTRNIGFNDGLFTS